MRTPLLLAVFAVMPFFSNAQGVQVDPLTGKPDVYIPFWQLTNNDLSVPIGLRHHGNAIQVFETEGAGGLGWNLVADGAIYRTVRGLPDDYSGPGSDLRRGWLLDNNAQAINGFSSSSDNNLSVCSDEVADYNFIHGLGYVKDSEPDLFSFQAPGLAGQFVFDADGLPRLLTYDDLKIAATKDVAGKILKFTVTSNLGVEYEFSIQETATRRAERFKNSVAPSFFQTNYKYYRAPLTYIASWKLSKIKSPSGAVIAFSYSNDDDRSSPRYYSIITEANAGDTVYYLNDKIASRRLERISSGIFEVAFAWHNDLLNAITISEDHGIREKRFDLHYQMFLSSLDPLHQLDWPPRFNYFLKTITQSDNCLPFPAYSFDYDQVDYESDYVAFPNHKGNQADIWGFYNGNAANNRPTIYYYASQTGAERFRTEPIAGSTPTSIISADNMQVGLGGSSFGALTQISYPSGGYTLINYEANRYWDPTANTWYYGGGVRVSNITTTGGEVPFGKISSSVSNFHSIRKEYEYLQADGKSSGKLLYHPVFAFAYGPGILRSSGDMSPGAPEILYERVTEKIAGQGKIIYEFNLPGTYPATATGDWKATVSKIARKPGGTCIPAGNMKNGPYTFPFPPNTNYDFERGLPSRIADYSEDNTLVKERLFTYARNPQAFTTIKGLKYEQIGDVYHFGIYEILTGTSKAVLTETTKIADESNVTSFLTNTTTYGYSTVHALLESVTSQNSDGTAYKERFKYAKDFSAITSPQWKAARGVFKLNAANRHGTVIEKIQSSTPAGGTELVTGAELNLYKDFGTDRVLRERKLIFPTSTAFSESSIAINGSDQKLNYDSADYIPVSIIEKYDMNGNPVDVRDNNLNLRSLHYGFMNMLPVAFISNALASQVVYSDFESNTGFEWTVSTSPIPTSAGWTGEKALQMSSAMTLQRDNVDKGSATHYRVSCWVKAAAAATLTLRVLNGSTLVTSVTLSYSSPFNTWKYLEGQIAVTTAPALFKAQLITSAAISIDDIMLLPASATVTTKTYSPLVGVTSQTDDRGNSVVYAYDGLGPLSNTYDRNRNLVQFQEYQFQVQPVQPVDASFTSSVPFSQLYRGTTTTFTPAPNCVSPVTYVWKINGVQVSTAPTLTHTFSALGNCHVELTVTAPNGTATGSTSFCVSPHTILPGIQAQGGNVIHKCDISYSKTFDAFLLLASDCMPEELKYTWYYESAGNWIQVGVPSSASTFSFDITAHGPPRSYLLRCEVTGKCGVTTAPCVDTFDVTGAQEISITFNNPPAACP